MGFAQFVDHVIPPNFSAVHLQEPNYRSGDVARPSWGFRGPGNPWFRFPDAAE